MKRDRIIRLLWIAVGVHVLYLSGAGLVFVFQKQIVQLFMPMVEDVPAFSFLFLMADSMFSLILHIVLTAILAESLKRGITSIAGEVFGFILFSGVISFLGMFVGRVITIYIGRFMGSMGLAGYSVIMQAMSALGPVRSVAVSLLFVAIGMSIYSKLEERSGLKAGRFDRD